MPNGVTHNRISTTAALTLGLGYVSGYYVDPAQIPVVMAGTLAGILLTPDHDVDDGNITYKYMRDTGLFFPLILWRFLWMPYALGFRHRSPWSHTPIFSTVFRLLYLICPLVMVLVRDQTSTSRHLLLFYGLIAQVLTIPFIFLTVSTMRGEAGMLYYVLPFLGGLLLSDVLHILHDIF